MPEFHAEPYLYLAGLTHKAALIAWGGFYFRVRDQKLDGDLKLVDDGDLKHVHPPRNQTIGASSEPYGNARVEVFNASGALAGFAETATANHVWVTGLSADTEYTYRVVVNGEEWGAGERRDWMAGPDGQGLKRNGRSYDNRFRTHPAPDQPASLAFAALGDFGTGVRKPSDSGRRQREVGAALERAVDERKIRLILTTGDNIYAGKTFFGLPAGDTGDEDDDWFFTFYQPYRYIINRVPVYPCVGNHDTSETEKSDDRQQLIDNFYINERFSGEQSAGRASIGPGLFYRFNYGKDIEFVCIDSSRQSALFGDRFFAHPNHVGFVEAALPNKAGAGADARKWRIPFSHHPPFCAGPQHPNTKSMIQKIVPLLKRAGVLACFSGHEHNFQHSQSEGINYFITGGGGKVSGSEPSNFKDAHTVSWASKAHFLVVDVEADKMTVTPIAEMGKQGGLTNLSRSTPSGGTVDAPIVVQ
jgi:tartrate-resistant acid phosphatase type 5